MRKQIWVSCVIDLQAAFSAQDQGIDASTPEWKAQNWGHNHLFGDKPEDVTAKESFYYQTSCDYMGSKPLPAGEKEIALRKPNDPNSWYVAEDFPCPLCGKMCNPPPPTKEADRVRQHETA